MRLFYWFYLWYFLYKIVPLLQFFPNYKSFECIRMAFQKMLYIRRPRSFFICPRLYDVLPLSGGGSIGFIYLCALLWPKMKFSFSNIFFYYKSTEKKIALIFCSRWHLYGVKYAICKRKTWKCLPRFFWICQEFLVLGFATSTNYTHKHYFCYTTSWQKIYYFVSITFSFFVTALYLYRWFRPNNLISLDN